MKQQHVTAAEAVATEYGGREEGEERAGHVHIFGTIWRGELNGITMPQDELQSTGVRDLESHHRVPDLGVLILGVGARGDTSDAALCLACPVRIDQRLAHPVAVRGAVRGNYDVKGRKVGPLRPSNTLQNHG